MLSRKRRMTPPVAAIFDGEEEAKLIALACSEPPKGRARDARDLLPRGVPMILHAVGLRLRAHARNRFPPTQKS